MPPDMPPYTMLAGFENIYLEDSWVRDIEARPGRLVFRTDVVLTPEHPAYTAPLPGEQHCYRASTIEFGNVRELVWREQGQPPAVDASDELDYGNIDDLRFTDGRYELEGDWGRIEVTSDPPVVRLD